MGSAISCTRPPRLQRVGLAGFLERAQRIYAAMFLAMQTAEQQRCQLQFPQLHAAVHCFLMQAQQQNRQLTCFGRRQTSRRPQTRSRSCPAMHMVTHVMQRGLYSSCKQHVVASSMDCSMRLADAGAAACMPWQTAVTPHPHSNQRCSPGRIWRCRAAPRCRDQSRRPWPMWW